MRATSLILILANLGFWAWTSWVLPQPDRGSSYAGPDLVIVGAAEPSAPGAAGAEPVLPVSPDLATRWSAVMAAADAGNVANRDRCIAIGPFSDAGTIDEAVTTLTAAGFQPEPTLAEAEIWDGFWIFVRAIDDMNTANQMLDGLAEAGVSDAYIIPDSDSGILISLGVFASEARAAARLGRVNALGYAATIADQMRTGEATFIEFPVSADEAIRFAGLRHPDQPRRLELRDCAAEAVAGESAEL